MLRRAGLAARGARLQLRGLATVIDGKAVAQQVLEEVRVGAAALHARMGHRPSLGVVLVGRRRDSVKYVAMKEQAARRVGFNLHRHDLAQDEPQETIEAVVSAASSEPTTHGVLVQLPLPREIDQQAVLMRVDPEKDVDGFHPVNAGLLSRCGEELRRARRPFDASTACNVPCTPLGCIGLLDAAGVELEGRHVVVMGRSNLVGLPMSLMLVHRHATVTVLNSCTPSDTAMALSRTADVVISAMGRPEVVGADWIKPGATVIDVGINFVADPSKPDGMRLCGDVDFESVRQVAGAITPVPGGVGPMTVATLMRNTLRNAERMLAAGEA